MNNRRSDVRLGKFQFIWHLAWSTALLCALQALCTEQVVATVGVVEVHAPEVLCVELSKSVLVYLPAGEPALFANLGLTRPGTEPYWASSSLDAQSFFSPRRIRKNGAFEARLFRRLGCAVLTLQTTRYRSP